MTTVRLFDDGLFDGRDVAPRPAPMDDFDREESLIVFARAVLPLTPTWPAEGAMPA